MTQVTVQPFAEFAGKTVNKYIITRRGGLQVSVINYGATITSLIVPDRQGAPGNVVLGFDTLEEYINAGDEYIGGICGRYANRIAGGYFRINGHHYQLPKNNGGHCLHGGTKGFDKVYWEARICPEEDAVEMYYHSCDGEQGFPGEVKVWVTYRLAGHSLHIDYRAQSSDPTPVNLTSHGYFNLSGGADPDIRLHHLEIVSRCYLEVNNEQIPNGECPAVQGTPMDFTEPRLLLPLLLHNHDHSWVLNKADNELCRAASLYHMPSGRRMNVFTTKPGLHFYTGHHLRSFPQYSGLCLEAQYFPDSPNHRNFPSTILLPGEVYRHTTIYDFPKQYSSPLKATI